MPIQTRWSRYKAPSPPIQPLKPSEPWWKTLWVNSYSLVVVLGYMVALSLLMPAIKLGLFHWQAWEQWKRGNRGGAIAIFVLACAVVDAGIV
jgi:hypothetical protein